MVLVDRIVLEADVHQHELDKADPSYTALSNEERE